MQATARQASMKQQLSQYEAELGRKQRQLAHITQAGEVRLAPGPCLYAPPGWPSAQLVHLLCTSFLAAG